jgi:hypothetical protein
MTGPALVAALATTPCGIQNRSCAELDCLRSDEVERTAAEPAKTTGSLG